MYTSSDTSYRDKTRINNPLLYIDDSAHYSIANFLCYSFTEFKFFNEPFKIESTVVGVLGVDDGKNSYRFNEYMSWTPSILFKALPFYEQYYGFSEFERNEKICVSYPDGLNRDGEYDEEFVNNLNYPMVFYSPSELSGWACMFILAQLNLCPQNETFILEIVKKYFNVEDCLILMNEKFMGVQSWSFGLEGKYADKQNQWLQEASDPILNIPYLKWLAMAEATWLRAISLTNPK